MDCSPEHGIQPNNTEMERQKGGDKGELSVPKINGNFNRRVETNAGEKIFKFPSLSFMKLLWS
jgi:hypothetical protein